MSKSIIPIGDRILVEASPAEEKTASGIIIPDTAKDRPVEGIVIEAGKTVEYIAKGDRVVYANYAGTEIEVEGKKYLVMREADILVVIE